MHRLALAVLSLAFLAACQPATTELTEEQKAEIAEDVRQALTAAWASWREQADITEYVSNHSGWAGSPWGCCSSLDDLRSYAQGWWDRWDIESVEDGEMSVMVLGPDAAAVRLISNMVRVDTAGVRWEGTQDQGTVMVREAGKWKLLMAKSHVTRRDN